MFHTIYDPKNADATPDNLGGKGYGLWAMQQIPGINIPLAVILPTGYSIQYNHGNQAETMAQLMAMWPDIKKLFKDTLGYMPLVSVRSGAKVSMPGMMDTVLNVGIDKKTSAQWIKRLGKDVFKDTFDRLIKSFTDTCYGKTSWGVEPMTQYKAMYGEWPDADAQVFSCMRAVLESWTSERAVSYRELHKLSHEAGTAIVIQAMVFGNANDKSATGVLFTRDPDSGKNFLTGEFLVKAQGEDVVAGTHTPLPLGVFAQHMGDELAKELWATAKKIETVRGDAQDIEFTIEDGKLWILQSRVAKRSARAAIRIALDRIDEGVPAAEALAKVTMREYGMAQVTQVLTDDEPLVTGLPACAGAATGVVVLSTKAALECKTPCILVRDETDPDDIVGIHTAVAIVTKKGGATSHAAVIARSMNKPAVVGCGDFDIAEGDTLTVDGASGRVWAGAKAMTSGMGPEIAALHAYAYAELEALPAADTAIAKEQVLDISSRYLDPDFGVRLMADVASCEKVVLVHTPDAFENRHLQLFGIERDQRWAMVKTAIDALPSDLRERITLAGAIHGLNVKALEDATDIASVVNAESDYYLLMDFFKDNLPSKALAMKKIIAWKAEVEGFKPVVINSDSIGSSRLYATPAYAVEKVLGG